MLVMMYRGYVICDIQDGLKPFEVTADKDFIKTIIASVHEIPLEAIIADSYMLWFELVRCDGFNPRLAPYVEQHRELLTVVDDLMGFTGLHWALEASQDLNAVTLLGLGAQWTTTTEVHLLTDHNVFQK